MATTPTNNGTPAPANRTPSNAGGATATAARW